MTQLSVNTGLAPGRSWATASFTSEHKDTLVRA